MHYLNIALISLSSLLVLLYILLWIGMPSPLGVSVF